MQKVYGHVMTNKCTHGLGVFNQRYLTLLIPFNPDPFNLNLLIFNSGNPSLRVTKA